MARTNTSSGGGGGGVESLNGLTGAVTLSAGNNVTLNESGNDIEITANFTQEGKYMISGGITWSGTGLTYDVSFLNYFFNGNKTANPTQVTLDASDPTDNRFDAIVVDEAGTVTAITGTPSANPEVPAIPEDQLQVTIILVAAGSTTPTIASEEIYMDDPTTGWTFSTYQTATPTGSINFAGTSSPKQGTECIEASTDARLGARFVRGTSFDAFQYTMLQVWVRFTGTAVATNKSLNVRFENSAGTLVANTVNLFNYGLQRGVLNTWQLVVVPITAFGALPTTVKGLKVIMAGGTVGVVRQWDIDYMILTNGSVPFANVPTIAFYKDDIGIASQSGINLIEGTGVTIDAVNNPLYNRVDYTINSSGGGTPAGSNNQIQINQGGAFFADSTFQKSDTDFNVGLDHTQQSAVTFTGSGLDDLTVVGAFSGTAPTTYTVTIDGVNQEFLRVDTSTISGGSFAVSDTVTNGTGGSADIVSISVIGDSTYLRVTINSGSFASGDVIDNGSGVTGTLNNNQTTYDTITYTDGVVTETNVPTFSEPTYFVNGLLFVFGATTGHTLTNEWTWDYTTVNQNVLDFSNNDYKFQSVFGTDTFGYHIGDNLFGYGIKGSLNTYTNVAGDQMLTGYADVTGAGFIGFYSLNLYSTGEIATMSAKKNGIGYSLKDSFGENIVQTSSGVTTLGNIDGGNNTKITIDDVNEQITISNLSAYDDDTAAGVGGLTAGMVYMTTGSGSAPLNTPGIFMIKQ